jgi:hypothetical protein
MRAFVSGYTSGIGLRAGYEGRIPTRMRCVLAGRTYRHLCIRQGQDATRPNGSKGRQARTDAAGSAITVQIRFEQAIDMIGPR